MPTATGSSSLPPLPGRMHERVRVCAEAVGSLNEITGPVRAGLILYAIKDVIHPSTNIPLQRIQGRIHVVLNVLILSLTTLCGVFFNHRRFTGSVLLAEL